MRSMHLSHAMLASLLWCTAVFVFVGMNFMRFEEASRRLQDSRIETALGDLQKVFQLEMDKGSSLPQLKKVETRFSRYMSEDPNVLSVLVFGARSGRILFSTVHAQAGLDVPAPWVEKCKVPGTVFVETANGRETVGMPIFNAFGENAGCVVSEYKTEAYRGVREKMIKTAFNAAVRLALVGIMGSFLLYFFGLFAGAEFMPKRRLWRNMILGGAMAVLVISVPVNFSAMFSSFESDLKQNIAAKAQVITRIVQGQIERAVDSGVPFKAVNGMEAYLEQIRRKNPEILFILVTDKSGRVLYEAGSASEAFDADPRTGKISLRKGYYNAAQPVNAQETPVGWVQIGVNERFVREKIF